MLLFNLTTGQEKRCFKRSCFGIVSTMTDAKYAKKLLKFAEYD
jgi:hypothetical protein